MWQWCRNGNATTSPLRSRRGSRRCCSSPTAAGMRIMCGCALRCGSRIRTGNQNLRYLPLSDADRSEMLRVIGANSIDDLFTDVPEGARLNGTIHDLPDHASELSVERQLGALARRNIAAGEVPFFIGCGAYRHHIPASADHIIQRGEFLTSYTPYQPEIAQGTLQCLFEFQTQVARLYGCDVA